jgi:hypothetical protein
MDLKVGIAWKLRINQTIFGNANADFLYNLKSQYIGVYADTTNVNPRNVVGYLTQTLNISILGGRTEINERFTLINKIPNIIIFTAISNEFNFKFRFASPVGNCQIKIWEYVINPS